MLYVKIPKDLRDYKQKVFMGRTSQELFWIVLALVLGCSTYVLCYLTVGTQIGSYVTMLISIPVFLCGFVTIQDMPTLEFLKKVLKFYKVRQYLTYQNELVNKRKEKDSKEKKKFRKKMKKMRENSF